MLADDTTKAHVPVQWSLVADHMPAVTAVYLTTKNLIAKITEC